MTTPTTVSVRLQLRADTAANWTSANPTLLANELGRETDTGKIKIGDGSTAWSSLAYQAWATLPIAVASGGTGQTSYTNGQLLIGNTTGNTLTKATLTAGSGIAITNGTGSITVAASGISDAQIAADAEIAVSKLADGAARQLLQTDAAGTGVEWASNIDIPGTLDVTSAATFDSTIGASAGTASLPSITFTGDLNTGIYSPGADQVAISTAGSGRLFVNSAGDVSIGRSSTSRQVLIYNDSFPVLQFANSTTGATANDGLLIYQSGSDAAISNQEAGFIKLETNNQERLRITSAGLVGIGTLPNAPLETAGANGTISIFRTNNATAANNAGGGFDATASATASSRNAIMWLDADGANFAGSDYFYIQKNGNSGSVQIIQQSNAAMEFHTNGSLRATIDSSGRLLVGTSTSVSVAGLESNQQIFGSAPQLSITRGSNNASGATLALAKSRNTAYGSRTIVTDGDTLGSIRFCGDDGVDLDSIGAQIAAQVDGTPGSDDLPSRLVFSTTADGASSPTERMRITSTGQLRLAGAGITFNGDTAAANELDDYEEGTWTPAYQTSNSDISITSTTVGHAVYTKIGNRVFCTCRFFSNVASVGTGTVRVTGLPFTSASSQGDVSCVISFAARFSTAAPVTAAVRASATSLDLITVYTDVTAGGNVTYMPAANLRAATANTNIISISLNYIV